ncbi:MAG: ATP-dependent helicase [Candidatus Dormibacteraeota bacterium]|nr:ATP-dependent helicase [Candidatus Dormibacteraeota bacterium]
MSSSTVLASPLQATPLLDSEQQRAVAHRLGPCLVLAGPGSGKTRVIVERFLALLEDRVSPDQQLVLTYTRKAADEMRARAESAHGPFAGEPPLTTFHSFAYRVVREWGWLAGISPAVRIVDAAERWIHAESVLDELRPATLWHPLRPYEIMESLLGVIGTAKQELVTPAAYAAWAAAGLEACTDDVERKVLQRHADVAAVYNALDERYRRLGVFDHDDCILYAERLLREEPAARRAVTERIRYVMVDEYQDTNYSQARLVETLVKEHRNVLVVADDDQSIYKFRGASRANLDRFEREYPEHETVVLTHNYRSTPQIVAAARRIIAGAPAGTRIDKQLVAERDGERGVEIWYAPDERSEVHAVAERCRELLAAGTTPASIAWLFRQHADMQPAMDALRRLGVPYQVSGGRGYFQQREVKDVLAMLQAAADPEDSLAVLRCLNLPSWRLSNSLRVALAAATRDHEVPLSRLISDGGLGLDDESLVAARRCVDDVLDLHALAQREDVRDVFWEAMQRSAYLGFVDEQEPVARLQIAANLNKFGELLESFADWSDDRSIGKALRYLEVLRHSNAASEIAAIEPIETGIMLLTAHAAKGLEWPVVFIAACSRDGWNARPGAPMQLQLPDVLVPEPPPLGDGPLDEERRLFYVAATRARDQLVFSWSRRQQRRFGDQVETSFLEGVAQGDLPAERRALTAVVPPPVRPRRSPGEPLPVHPSLGVSDLSTFKKCPRQFEYRTVWRLPARQTVQSWYGTLIHSVLRIAAVQRMSGVDVDGASVAALWAEAWDGNRGPKGARPELKDLGDRQLRDYVATSAWVDARIDAVEQRLIMDVSSAEIVGRLDRIDVGADGRRVVVDYKTSPPKDPQYLRRDLQVRAYAMTLSQLERRNDVGVELHYLQTGEVARVDFDSDALDTAYKHISATANEIVSSWRRGDFAARPSQFECSRCPYRTVCDEAVK